MYSFLQVKRVGGLSSSGQVGSQSRNPRASKQHPIVRVVTKKTSQLPMSTTTSMKINFAAQIQEHYFDDDFMNSRFDSESCVKMTCSSWASVGGLSHLSYGRELTPVRNFLIGF